MTPRKHRVLVLGCGIGGLTLASRLVRKTRKKALITVIDRKTSFELPASFPWVMMRWKKPSQAQRSLTPLTRKGVRVVNDEVEKIDIRRKTVKTSKDEFSYDDLVISLGASYMSEQVPGLEENAHHIYDLEHAVKFRDALAGFKGERIIVAISRLPFKCPAAPYETALLLEEHFRLAGRKVKIDIYTAEMQPLPAAGPVIGRQMRKLLENRGVGFYENQKLQWVEQGKAIFDSGDVASDLLFVVPPHACPKPVVDAGLNGPNGWVIVNPQTLTTKHDGVYALGDVAAVETSHGHVPFLPKAGIFARGQAEVLADNLSTSITGKGRVRAWDGTGHCFLATGRDEAAFLRGSFLSNPPRLEFHPPSKKWHEERIAFEKKLLTF